MLRKVVFILLVILISIIVFKFGNKLLLSFGGFAPQGVVAKREYNAGHDYVKDLKKHPRTKSEARAIAELERLTGVKFPTVCPDFMIHNGKRLELDGYNKELGVAVEFSGPLHTKWYPDRESYEKYISRVETDKLKKELCANNGVLLIVIDMRLPVRHYRNYFASRLYDAKKITEPPDMYIAEQVFEPFIRGRD